MHYLTDWCAVRKDAIVKNGQVVFKCEAAGTEAFLLEAYKWLEVAYPKFYKMDKLCQLGFIAAETLLKGTAWSDMSTPEDTGIVLANGHSSLDTDARYVETIQSFPSPALFVYTLANIMIGEICIRHKLKGENTVFIFEKYEIPFLTSYIDHLLASGAASLVVGGWVDAMGSRYEAFLYLATPLKTGTAIVHDHINIEALYGKLDTGFESTDH